MPKSTLLPDVAAEKTHNLSMLQWVGMEDIAVPVNIEISENRSQPLTAKANVYVSLNDPAAKGIHMSRLHSILNDLATKPLNKNSLDSILARLVASQAGINRGARLNLSFDLLLTKPALISEQSGFQTYPVELEVQCIDETYRYFLKLAVPYSSTCPCSSALSRQLLSDSIDQIFPADVIDKAQLLEWTKENAVATPHSQRSYAYLDLTLSDQAWPDLPDVITQIEDTLATSVQTLVKRVDEQAFARLNAENLMFSEDAARKIKAMLEALPWVADYWFKVEHQESLHAHNAVVIDQKYW